MMLLAGCGQNLPDQINLSTQLTGGDPKTLEAATAAAQEWVDRRAAGDYEGVWLLYSKQIQEGISQSDYVTLSQACGKDLYKIPITVTGVRMDGDNRAIVRAKPLGFSVQLSMVYETGKWVVPPDADFASELGTPVSEIIASRKAAGRCGDEDLFSPTATATATTSTPSLTPATNLPPSAPVIPPSMPVPPSSTATLPDAATSDVREVRTAGAHLVAVRLGPRDRYDRLVLEFADRVPGYTVGYRPLPAQADASGAEIPLPGASALVQVSLTPATGSGWTDGARTYFGPSTITGSTTVVTEVKAAGDFEAVLTWVAGLRAKVPFRVLELDGPPRLVVDFQH